MSRKVHGRLRKMTAEDRAKKLARNIRRGRPRFGFTEEGKRYAKFYADREGVGNKVLVAAPNGRTAIMEKKDF